MQSYRTSSATAVITGATFVQQMYMDDSGFISTAEVSGSTSLVKKYLKNDNSSLIFKKEGFPNAIQFYQVTGGFIWSQIYADGLWTQRDPIAYDLYHGVLADVKKRIAVSPNGDLYHLNTYVQQSTIRKSSDYGATYTIGADISGYGATGLLSPSNGLVIAYAGEQYTSAWGGCKISTNFGTTFTTGQATSGMRFDNMVSWSSQNKIMGVYNNSNRIFTSSTSGLSWNSTSYSTSGFLVAQPVDCLDYFAVKDIFIFADELYAITSYQHTDLNYRMQVVKWTTPPSISGGAGTVVNTFQDEFSGGWNSHHVLSEVTLSPTDVMITFTSSSDGYPTALNLISNKNFHVWDNATSIPPTEAQNWYDKKTNKFVRFYSELEMVYTQISADPEIWDYVETPVGIKTAYWTPGTDTPTMGGSEYQASHYGVNAYAIINK